MANRQFGGARAGSRRVFHADWQFCPFDGAKRPANASSDWQFCPICGKSIKPDSKPGN